MNLNTSRPALQNLCFTFFILTLVFEILTVFENSKCSSIYCNITHEPSTFLKIENFQKNLNEII